MNLSFTCDCGTHHDTDEQDTSVRCECGTLYAVTVTPIERSPDAKPTAK